MHQLWPPLMLAMSVKDLDHWKMSGQTLRKHEIHDNKTQFKRPLASKLMASPNDKAAG